MTGEPGIGKTTAVESFLLEIKGGAGLAADAARNGWPAPSRTCRFSKRSTS